MLGHPRPSSEETWRALSDEESSGRRRTSRTGGGATKSISGRWPDDSGQRLGWKNVRSCGYPDDLGEVPLCTLQYSFVLQYLNSYFVSWKIRRTYNFQIKCETVGKQPLLELQFGKNVTS